MDGSARRGIVLVTGAGGKTGQAVTRGLLQNGFSARGFVNSVANKEKLERIGCQDIFIGDMLDETDISSAMQGVEGVYHICPNMHAEEIRIAEIAINAAQEAGVEHFVYHSVMHPQVEAMPHHWSKMRVEEMLFVSGLNFTVLQPAAYMQNVMGNFRGGVYSIPYSLNAKISMVDLKDVAEVVGKIMLDVSHYQAVYELCGSEVFTQFEIAEILAEAYGKKISAQEIPISEWEQGAKQTGLTEGTIQALVKMFRYYDMYGFMGNDNILKMLLGRPPTLFSKYLEKIKSRSQ